MELKNKRKLEELKRLYGYDIAELKQKSNIIEELSEQELLDSLVICQMQHEFVNTINNLGEYISKDVMTTLISNIFGNIINQLVEENCERSERFFQRLECIKAFEDKIHGDIP